MRRKVITTILIFLFVIILILLYGYAVEPNLFITKEYTIKDPNLPDSFDGVKIVHFSDLHYGRNISLKSIDKVVKEINFIKPDIVFFTGDLVETPNELKDKDFEVLADYLRKIDARIGKYAVLGEHDYEGNTEVVKSTLTTSGFDILLNESDAIYNNSVERIVLYGIDDVLKGYANLDKTFESDNEDYKIVLVHEPDYVDDILEKVGSVNLILSGHSHDGQVKLPFLDKLYNIKGATLYYGNYYRVGNTNVYVSSGLGVSTYTFRLFNPPSINFYRINKES